MYHLVLAEFQLPDIYENNCDVGDWYSDGLWLLQLEVPVSLTYFTLSLSGDNDNIPTYGHKPFPNA